MEHRVELSPRAFADVDAIVEYIQADSRRNAVRWRRRLFERIAKLSRIPRGYSIAPEDKHCSIEVRQAIFGRYRILFTVLDEDSLVYVLTVRHAARLFMSADEFDAIE